MNTRFMKNSDCNLWDILAPPDISYFRLPVYQHFSGRAFHIRTVRQELDILRFREDFASRLVRSDVRVDPERPADQREQIDRLLFRLTDDVFCDLGDFQLTVYALTWSQAAQFAEQLAKKYVKAKPV